MMEDWVYGLVIVITAAAWAHIFADYRKKLAWVMPGVEHSASRRSEYRNKIDAAEASTRDIIQTMEELNQELVTLNQRRLDLQQQLNKAEMILIPASRFMMGSNAPGFEDENPQHPVRLKSYYMDKYEVTNIQYKDFVDVTGRKTPTHWRNRTFPARLGNHPVTNVTWQDAEAYAQWAQKRLPTEAEWEHAARGERNTDYPWGKICSPDYLNYASPEGSTTEVTKYDRGVSPWGVWDMCGNVGEWVADWYDPKYYLHSPEVDPPGPEEGQQKVHRGGGYHGNRKDVRACARHQALPAMYQGYIGFRCAMDAG